MEDAPAGTSVSLRTPEAGVDLRLKTDADGKAPFEVETKKLALWSPESPRLYKVEVASGADRINDEIGLRAIRVDGTRILLDGNPVFLRGANMHAEAPYRTGSVIRMKTSRTSSAS